jgi:DNA-binding CsgD family transcriptional regulator
MDLAGPRRTPSVSHGEVVDGLAAALVAAPAGPPRWVLLEGPPGRGAARAVGQALGIAAAEGRTARRITAAAPEAAVGVDEVGALPAGPLPEVVAVDDLQWLAPETLRALDRALGAAGSPTVVVASVRTGVPPRDPDGLVSVRGRDETVIVPLAPLDATAVARLLAARQVAHAPALAEPCTTLTSGNPLLVTRLAEHLATLGPDVPPDAALERASAAVLPRVARFCGAHVGRLDPDTRALVAALTVLGDDTPLWLAVDVAELPRARVTVAADVLIASGLLSSRDPLRLAMPLAWRALAGAPDDPRTHALHLRAAQLLARTADGAEAAAEHLLATPAAGQAWVAEVLREAARAATEDGRHAAAVARLERALTEPLPAELQVELLVELGDGRDRGGTGDATAAYRQALRISAEERRPPIHLRLGRALYGAGDYRDAALELDRALAIVDAEDPLAVELLAAYVAAARFDRTLEDAAARHIAPVLDRAGPTRTPAERALLAEVALERGIRGAPRPDVVGVALRAWGDGLLLEGADHYGISLSQVAAALTWSDAFADAQHVLTAALERAERDGDLLVAATARYLRAWPRYYVGALTESEADARAALDASGWEMYEPSARAILGHVLLERGDHAGAQEALVLTNVEPWRRTVPYAMLLETRARLHVAAGDLDAAATDLTEAGALLETMGNRSPFCPWRSSLGVVRALQGDHAAARELVDTEIVQAEAIGTPRARGVALHARATVARLSGGDGAVADLREAIALLAGCDARVEQARALVSLGATLTDAGESTEARASLHEAIALAAGIGAQEIGERAGRELHRAGGRRTGARTATPGGRTASELRVARLAARGRTNREIADEIVVSTHTVRFHLAGVYRKLGISRRDEIAARLPERDERHAR